MAIFASAAWLTAAIGVLASTLARNSVRGLFFTIAVISLFMLGSRWPELYWASQSSIQEMARYSQYGTLAPRLLIAAGLAVSNSVAAGLITLGSVKRLRATWGRA